MFKKIVISCATAVVLGNCFSAAVFASDVNIDKAAPIHWGSHPYNNIGESNFKTGKKFCAKKYRGKKTCIPAMNNTQDSLAVNTVSYGGDNAPIGTVVALMGKESLLSTTFTVTDTTAGGKTVYSGPANNREGIVCNEDQASKNITCAAWK